MTANNELLNAFLQGENEHTIINLTKKLTPNVSRQTIYNWCSGETTPSGPNGYAHRKQIEKITGGVVKADRWDLVTP